jgi:hypothetical protein
VDLDGDVDVNGVATVDDGPSTWTDHVQVQVAVKVHVHDYVKVNVHARGDLRTTRR